LGPAPQLEALGLPLSTKSLPSLPPFSETKTTLADVHKTGLGSSAALITSLCSALLLHLGAVSESAFGSTASPAENGPMALVHNVAQYCHCLAQGKVGSGFDVSSAVWGSQVYRKFGPDALDELMDESAVRLPRSVSDPPTASPADVLSPCVVDQPSRSLLPALQPENSRWTNEVAPFELPPHTRLMLADVDAGSDTPSLVGKVLKWRKESSDVGQSLLDRAARPHRASRLLLVLHSSPSRSQPELEYAIAPQRGPCGPLWHAEDARRAGP
jgi:phosphomevalonate kinase